MRFGLSIPNFAEPDRLLEIAVVADRAGWDGFLWDHILVETVEVAGGSLVGRADAAFEGDGEALRAGSSVSRPRWRDIERPAPHGTDGDEALRAEPLQTRLDDRLPADEQVGVVGAERRQTRLEPIR